ncbi:copper resistance protein NlpE N-terminal domain-containing protein [Lacinutrix sp. C3R15]|uniref:copper resistance protein NlpE N-terminal domain-containing protein n=1 Tax=Flavobacteriaceae TaxID=49546 RepID=UPI001C087044|nr:MULTISPECIES: copper resistance protein NlpE N-terminal domain-containing protein [Flavobacteriaceae]MBU2938253.1 copper resistance protein NlpE N-terminal domain-containing protein [Lacinutrix sp. C3R15]MDO6621567.1 copper resistance protein NlpE N-terminal domain-containing protein [Oceanihabitans sp. 1_MG-2023]
MKLKSIKLIAVLLILVTSCNSNKKENTNTSTDNKTVTDVHNSEITLDWPGTYTGTIPCADCEGIQKTITINKNKTFTATENYLGKEDAEFTSKGIFKWSEDGRTIVLSDANRTSFFVGENILTQLDKSGNKITGKTAKLYILKKQNTTIVTTPFTKTKWKLVELLGKKVENPNAYIAFSEEENMVYGNGTCNSFNGRYETLNGYKINMSNITGTLKACTDMSTEKTFFSILETVDNYTIKGDKMTLNRAKMAPLALFEAVK